MIAWLRPLGRLVWLIFCARLDVQQGRERKRRAQHRLTSTEMQTDTVAILRHSRPSRET